MQISELYAEFQSYMQSYHVEYGLFSHRICKFIIYHIVLNFCLFSFFFVTLCEQKLITIGKN